LTKKRLVPKKNAERNMLRTKIIRKEKTNFPFQKEMGSLQGKGILSAGRGSGRGW